MKMTSYKYATVGYSCMLQHVCWFMCHGVEINYCLGTPGGGGLWGPQGQEATHPPTHPPFNPPPHFHPPPGGGSYTFALSARTSCHDKNETI